MIIKTKGYVFRTLKYGEHQLITDIFTESNGLLTFIVPGARKGGVHSKGIFLQPLSSLDLIIEVQDGKNLQKIKEIKFDRLFTNIQSDLRKGVIILFLGDVLRHCVKENAPNKELYDFIDANLQFLDQANQGFSNVTIYFLLHLTAHLGFFPVNEWTENDSSLNLKEGYFEPFLEIREYNLEAEPSRLLDQFMNIPLQNISIIKLSRDQRLYLIDKIIWYYRFHLDFFPELKSLPVLKEIF
jgi:DNA repair protein RecO (recombination protein O)